MAERRLRTALALARICARPQAAWLATGAHRMAAHITIMPASGTVTIRANGAVIGETERALELREGSAAPVLYVPRADMAMALLDKTARQTTCPHKGQASYYSIVTPGGTLENVVWSYEAPLQSMQDIAGHLAFYTDRVTVERR